MEDCNDVQLDELISAGKEATLKLSYTKGKKTGDEKLNSSFAETGWA